MAVAVFDADALIGYLDVDDIHHSDAVERMRQAVEPGTRRMVCAVNYSEVLIGPLHHGGTTAAAVVREAIGALGFEVITVDMALAERAAAVRARTRLKLPDAYALATAVHAEKRGHTDVRLETFDISVRRAHDALRPAADPLDQ